MTKPWEGRSVYCKDPKDGSVQGWVEIQERNNESLRLILRPAGLSEREIFISRDQAKTLAAHMMNLAGRLR